MSQMWYTLLPSHSSVLVAGDNLGGLRIVLGGHDLSKWHPIQCRHDLTAQEIFAASVINIVCHSLELWSKFCEIQQEIVLFVQHTAQIRYAWFQQWCMSSTGAVWCRVWAECLFCSQLAALKTFLSNLFEYTVLSFNIKNSCRIAQSLAQVVTSHCCLVPLETYFYYGMRVCCQCGCFMLACLIETWCIEVNFCLLQVSMGSYVRISLSAERNMVTRDWVRNFLFDFQKILSRFSVLCESVLSRWKKHLVVLNN